MSPLASSKWANSVIGEERVEDRGQPLGAERDVPFGDPQQIAVRRGEQAHRFRLVLDLPAERDEDRLVVLDEADHVVAGDVVRGHDHDLDQSKFGSRSMLRSRAWGSVERMVAPYQAPGKTRSSAYFAVPVSFSGPFAAERLRQAAGPGRWCPAGGGAGCRSGPACSPPHGIQS